MEKPDLNVLQLWYNEGVSNITEEKSSIFYRIEVTTCCLQDMSAVKMIQQIHPVRNWRCQPANKS